MYTAPGQGCPRQPLGDKMFIQQKFLITLPICCQFKKYLFEVCFFTLFSCLFFQRYIDPDRQPIEDKHFMTTERHFLFAHMLQVSK